MDVSRETFDKHKKAQRQACDGAEELPKLDFLQ